MAAKTPVQFEGREDLRKTFAEVQRAQTTILAMNKKIADKDPFSAKEIKKSRTELGTWNRFQKEKVGLLQQNEKVIKSLHAEEKKYYKDSFEGLKLTREINARQGMSNSLRSRINAGNAQAGALASGLGGVEKEIESEKRANAVSKLVGSVASKLASAGIAATIANLAGGWKAAQTEKNYSMISSPNEIGGWRTLPSGKKVPYGRMSPGIIHEQGEELKSESSSLGQINRLFGNTTKDVWQNAYQMRLAGGTGDSREWMRMGTMSGALAKTGAMSMGQMFGLESASVRGGGVGGKGGGFGAQGLADVVAKATALGLTGGRVGEFGDSIKNLMESAQVTAGNTDPKKFAETMYMINNTGKAYTQGARGEQIAQGMQHSLLSPGGGVAGKLMSLRAVGFGTDPKMKYFDAWRALHGGLTPDIAKNIFKNFRAGGNKNASIMAMVEWGEGAINPDQAEALLFGMPGGKKVAGGDINSFIKTMNTKWGGSTPYVGGGAALVGGQATEIMSRIQNYIPMILTIITALDRFSKVGTRMIDTWSKWPFGPRKPK